MVRHKKESESFEKSSKPTNAQKMPDYARFFTGIAEVKDEHLHIMRGHLLIEERLQELINQKLKKPDALIDARLSFNQLLCIAKAFYWEEGSEWLWEGISKLNSIRNGLSHKVMNKNYDRDVDAFLKLLEGDNPDKFSVKSRLVLVMAFIYCSLSEYVDEN